MSLQDANLRGTRLSGADLQKANLVLADLHGSDLEGADLRDANLAGARISPDTNLEGVNWDNDYISVLERRGDYEAAISLYRRLKEWYRGAGMIKIAGDFHFREMEAQRKAGRQQFWKEIQQFGWEFKEFKGRLALEWKRLMGKEG